MNTRPSFLGASDRTIGIACAVITILIWTSFIVVARYMALKSLAPLDISFLRLLGASVILVPWGWMMVRRMKRAALEKGLPKPKTWGASPLPFKVAAWLGGFGGVAYAVFAYMGFVYAPAAHASVLMPGMLPLTTALFSVWLVGEVVNRGRKLGLAMIFTGGMLVGGSSLLQAFEGGQVWRGDLFFVLASTCWALYTVGCRKYQVDPVQGTIALVFFAVIVYVPSYIALVQSGALTSRLTTAPLWEMAFHTVWQGMGSIVISGITFTQMVRYFGPVRSTMLTAIVPPLSALAAVIFLNEPLGWELMVGLAMVTTGIIVGVRAAAK